MIDPASNPGVEVGPRVFVPADALRFAAVRSSGPGGQSVNKLATKVQLWVSLAALESAMGLAAVARLTALPEANVTDAGELLIVCEESRSQQTNRKLAMAKLRELIVRAQRVPRRRRATRPTKASRQRRLDSKRQRGQTKQQRRAPREGG